MLTHVAHPWASECPDVKNYKRRLNPVWYRMLYSCTHMTTVGVKGLTRRSPWLKVEYIRDYLYGKVGLIQRQCTFHVWPNVASTLWWPVRPMSDRISDDVGDCMIMFDKAWQTGRLGPSLMFTSEQSLVSVLPVSGCFASSMRRRRERERERERFAKKCRSPEGNAHQSRMAPIAHISC